MGRTATVLAGAGRARQCSAVVPLGPAGMGSRPTAVGRILGVPSRPSSAADSAVVNSAQVWYTVVRVLGECFRPMHRVSGGQVAADLREWLRVLAEVCPHQRGLVLPDERRRFPLRHS